MGQLPETISFRFTVLVIQEIFMLMFIEDKRSLQLSLATG
jgi:hypothetical protein